MVNMGEAFRFDRISDQECERVPLTDGERERFLLEEGDLLFVRQSLKFEGAGKCIYVGAGKEPRTWESHLIRVRLDPYKADSRYYYYYFRSPSGRASMESIIEQVAAAGIRGSDLRALQVPRPQRKEQGRIADILSALDDKIAVNDRIAETSEGLAACIASDEFWTEAVPLGDIVTQARLQVVPQEIESSVVAHYSLPAFDSGYLPELAAPSTIKSSKFVVDGPSVLLSKLNPSIPRIWSVEPAHGIPALASTEFLVLRPIDGISPDEIWAVCSQPGFIGDLISMVTGTSNSHQRVRPADLLATHVVDPRFIARSERGAIHSLMVRAREARFESRALEQLRDTLLPKLMSGEIRVRDAEKVVEDVT